MELRAGYKRTEVGVIPEDWEVKRLGDFVALRRGHDLTWRDRHSGEVPVMGSAGQNGLHHVALVRGPGVVIGRSGASFGQAHYCDVDFWPHNTALYVTDFNGNDVPFSYYFLKAFDFERFNSGGAQQSLNRNFIGPIEVAIPPLPEQRAIAEALGDVDALIRSLDQLTAKKRDIKQAAMQQLLTGRQRLPGFAGAWQRSHLGDLGTFRKGKGIRKDDVLPEGLPCVRYGELYTVHETQIRRFASFVSPSVAATAEPLRFGDLIFAGSGETKEEIGKCVTYLGHEQAYVGGDTVVFSPRFADPLLLAYLMNHPAVQVQKARMGQGDAVVHISSGSLAKLEFNLPPLDEQRAIAEVLSDLDAELTALEARRDKTQALKQGMMQALLTGRTRLV